MATKPLPRGTVNFPVNLPHELRRAAGRLAFIEDRSLGAMIREYLAERVEAARRAGILDTAGQQVIRLGLVALLALGMGSVIGALLCGADARTVRRGGRRRDDIAFICLIGTEGEA